MYLILLVEQLVVQVIILEDKSQYYGEVVDMEPWDLKGMLSTRCSIYIIQIYY